MPTIQLNRGLTTAETGGQTSTVGEPSVANDGQSVMFSGNWYASRSGDGGNTWTLVDPFTFFPAAGGGFCCDQTLLHAPGPALTVWLLQYITKPSGNTLRLAVHPGANFALGGWHWWDLRPGAVNSAWAGEWFDYNHAALSDNFLYVVTNTFTVKNNRWKRCVVLRFPLAKLQAGGTPSFDYFQTTTNGSLRCTQGATTVMHLASHQVGPGGRRQLRIWSWSESSTTATQRDVDVSSWQEGVYSAPCPGGGDWLTRCDPRITGGWVANGVIGFMWTANRQEGRPFPFVRVARIDESTHALIDEPDIWSSSFAYAYPDVTPNMDGVVGATLFRGGGSRFPGHAVGVFDDGAKTWSLAATKDGTHAPTDGKWGDYLTCRRFSPDGTGWIAAGLTLQGGGARNNVEPRVVVFTA